WGAARPATSCSRSGSVAAVAAANDSSSMSTVCRRSSGRPGRRLRPDERRISGPNAEEGAGCRRTPTPLDPLG
ncbi:MAG: hypothetical protein AVDCRST_MAG59-112, partial [uncultured Thermomicrobiales bacterium]